MIDQIGAIRGILKMMPRPFIHLYEGWQDEAGIDTTVWTPTNPATGAAWSRGAAGAYLRATSVPNLNETARLRSNSRWMVGPGVWAANTVLRSLTAEIEFRLTNVANIDNTLSFFGFTPNIGDNRGSDDIIGFALLADALQAVSDSGGVETTATGFGETLTNWNKLKFHISAGVARFYLNEVQIAIFTTNLPDAPMYINFFLDTEAGGNATIELGIVRLWTEDVV